MGLGRLRLPPSLRIPTWLARTSQEPLFLQVEGPWVLLNIVLTWQQPVLDAPPSALAEELSASVNRSLSVSLARVQTSQDIRFFVLFLSSILSSSPYFLPLPLLPSHFLFFFFCLYPHSIDRALLPALLVFTVVGVYSSPLGCSLVRGAGHILSSAHQSPSSYQGPSFHDLDSDPHPLYTRVAKAGRAC